ncbi:MAG: hypothetical protein NDI62_03385 [Burkholderiales bacterium]|nr:hypothetical protein [Burkholderiales bacterium]
MNFNLLQNALIVLVLPIAVFSVLSWFVLILEDKAGLSLSIKMAKRIERTSKILSFSFAAALIFVRLFFK